MKLWHNVNENVTEIEVTLSIGDIKYHYQGTWNLIERIKYKQIMSHYRYLYIITFFYQPDFLVLFVGSAGLQLASTGLRHWAWTTLLVRRSEKKNKLKARLSSEQYEACYEFLLQKKKKENKFTTSFCM